MKEESYVPKPQQPQMKEGHREEVWEEYAANTGTLDSYFIKSKIARS